MKRFATTKIFFFFLVFLAFQQEAFSQGGEPIELNPTVYQEPPSLNRQLDYQKPVSSIPGVVNVSGGAATYSIPIILPPGINGMLPDLSINYNSASGKGLLGMGWHLSGLSEIRRGNKNHLFDGFPDYVRLTNDDRLYLDGQAMFSFSGSNLQPGSLYKTQTESFQKIEMLGNGGFKVTSKDGIERFYGINLFHSLITLQDENSNNQTYIWPLEKVRDRNSNYIEYVYDNTNNKNESRLKKIKIPVMRK
ncbi:MAG: hypothetical protein JJU02_08595 [Cryomorphaceae bacterium]|nr:hypothetical protein [Cryomorphaceae bacterium]